MNAAGERTAWLPRMPKAWSARARRRWVLLVLAIACSCAPNRIPPPAMPLPRAGHPADAIPGDLDAVFRFELQAVRDVLGSSPAELLAQHGPAGPDVRDFALSWALSRADTAWLAIRPGLAADLTDNVLVVRGRLSGLESNLSSSWGGATDLGGGWFRYDRSPPSTRAAPARLYFHVNDLLVVVSTAEIDSTERAIERGAGDPRLRPPDKGTVSAAVRLQPIARLLEARSPRAAKVLRQGRELTATVELVAAGLTAELNVEFDLEDDARRAAEAIRLLIQAIRDAGVLPSELTNGLRVEAIGANVTLRARAPAEALRRMVSCLRSNRGCAQDANPSTPR